MCSLEIKAVFSAVSALSALSALPRGGSDALRDRLKLQEMQDVFQSRTFNSEGYVNRVGTLYHNKLHFKEEGYTQMVGPNQCPDCVSN
ncbi:hypothetical protein PGTUg99_024973 [Puccinia graminis f. sp. tritici]|uniref:Uncharacterized protein n=1 Tax=Puccinia graminis f. sp. tritici TaxID=56615 RepID=A0A5B0N235_PUCGR|nr:hypothetical protein PGTUg99_024973 [Puccinia graminis f. sp. tritici]